MASDPNIDKQICGKGSSANSGKGTKGHCNSSNVATGTVDIEKTDLGFESVLGERPQYRGGSGLVGSFGYSFG
ncbi:hypothetical protein, partial [Candidatus Anaplasma sp. TIGMIC]|uniref:hypothetical protein n=1 Tax=Candidatus Anaplasma sp. TIGMIC TaxID=3020713 RepID=UPI00232E88EB